MSDVTFFEATFQTIPDGVIITLASDGSVIDVNPGFERLTGYSRTDVVGRTTSAFGLWQNLGDRERFVFDLTRKGSVDDFVAHFRRKDETIVSVLVCATYLVHGDERYIVGICKNIDQWSNLTHDLDEMKSRYMEFVELLPAVLFECDEELRLTFLNAAGVRLFGPEVDARTNPALASLLVPVAKVDLLTWARDEAGKPAHSGIEVDARVADGNLCRSLLTISPIRGRQGQSRYLGVLLDISGEQIARTRLSKLSQAVEQSPSLVVITDKAGHIEYVNPSFTRVTGFSLGEAIGRTPRILRSGVVPEETYRTMWNTILEGREWKTEILNRKKNGETYWQRSTISPMYDERGNLTHFLEVAEDITREKELESALFQSQKMEAIGHLAGGIAHDFNNMLTIIIGVGELLQGKLGKNEELQSHVDSILSAARKSASLTHQLLAFSRKQLLNPEKLDLNVAVKDAEKLARRIVGDNIRIRTKLYDGLGLALLDQSQVHQIVLNLIVNAREAIAGSGTVTIRTEPFRCTGEAVVTSGRLKPGEYVLLSVADTGCGMDEQTLSHIFEPFFTTKANGTGLGLATVYGIVQQSNGQIHMQSEPGAGTTFTAYFPVVAEGSSEGRNARVDASSTEGTETILVVEDDAAVRTFIELVLANRGYTVLLADSAETALEIWNDVGSSVDLLLTDVVLPQENGVRLYASLRELKAELPVVYMSGYTEDSSSLLLELADGKVLLPKPFGAEQVAKAVRRVLDLRPRG